MLDQAPPGEAEATSLSQIAYGATQVATSVPAAAPPQPDTAEIGVLLVSRSGRLIAANAPAQAYVARFGFSGPPGGQTLSHLANFEVLAQARQRLSAAPGAPVIVKFL